MIVFLADIFMAYYKTMIVKHCKYNSTHRNIKRLVYWRSRRAFRQREKGKIYVRQREKGKIYVRQREKGKIYVLQRKKGKIYVRQREKRKIYEGPTHETLDFTIHFGSTPTFFYFYFDLYLNTAYAAHCVYSSIYIYIITNFINVLGKDFKFFR